MKRTLWISAIAVTVFAMSLNAFAQGPRGQGQGQGQGQQRPQGQVQGQVGPQGQMGGIATPQVLLRNAEVVKLLDITADQTTALNEALRPQRGGNTPGVTTGPAQLTPAERRAQTETQWTEIGKILKAEQLTKFKDIYFQANVPVANPNAPAGAPTPVMNLNVFLLGAVNLTADQKEKINKINDDLATANAATTRPAQGATQEERTAFTTAARERSTKANDAIKAVLTDAQKKKIDDLTAGAAKVRTDLNLNQRPAGGQQAPGQGGGQRGQGGGAASGFVPGQGAWQPGQDAPTGAQGGARGNRGTGGAGGGNFPRNAGN